MAVAVGNINELFYSISLQGDESAIELVQLFESIAHTDVVYKDDFTN